MFTFDNMQSLQYTFPFLFAKVKEALENIKDCIEVKDLQVRLKLYTTYDMGSRIDTIYIEGEKYIRCSIAVDNTASGYDYKVEYTIKPIDGIEYFQELSMFIACCVHQYGWDLSGADHDLRSKLRLIDKITII